MHVVAESEAGKQKHEPRLNGRGSCFDIRCI
jgi:hypothetical protein